MHAARMAGRSVRPVGRTVLPPMHAPSASLVRHPAALMLMPFHSSSVAVGQSASRSAVAVSNLSMSILVCLRRSGRSSGDTLASGVGGGIRIPHGRQQPSWQHHGWPTKPCSSSFHVALFAKVLLADLLLSVPCKRSFNAVRRRAGAHQ